MIHYNFRDDADLESDEDCVPACSEQVGSNEAQPADEFEILSACDDCGSFWPEHELLGGGYYWLCARCVAMRQISGAW